MKAPSCRTLLLAVQVFLLLVVLGAEGRLRGLFSSPGAPLPRDVAIGLLHHGADSSKDVAGEEDQVADADDADATEVEEDQDLDQEEEQEGDDEASSSALKEGAASEESSSQKKQQEGGSPEEEACEEEGQRQ